MDTVVDPASVTSEYLPEDVENLVSATQRNLCAACQVIFGPKEAWREAWRDSDFIYYEHHRTYEELFQCIQTRCCICVALYDRLDGPQDSVSFAFWCVSGIYDDLKTVSVFKAEDPDLIGIDYTLHDCKINSLLILLLVPISL